MEIRQDSEMENTLETGLLWDFQPRNRRHVEAEEELQVSGRLDALCRCRCGCA